MKILSRAEELILLTVLRLGKDATCVDILKHAQVVTKRKWSLGGVYIPLGRLENRGLVTSFLADPTAQRGGKSKRYYQITKAGIEELRKIKEVENTMWDGLSTIIDTK